jgi:hypothetical protein
MPGVDEAGGEPGGGAVAADDVGEERRDQAEQHGAVGVLAQKVGERHRRDDPEDLHGVAAQPDEGDGPGQQEGNGEYVEWPALRLALGGADRAEHLDGGERQR